MIWVISASLSLKRKKSRSWRLRWKADDRSIDLGIVTDSCSVTHVCSMQANVLEDHQDQESGEFLWSPIFNCGAQLQFVDSLRPPGGELSSVGGNHQCRRCCSWDFLCCYISSLLRGKAQGTFTISYTITSSTHIVWVKRNNIAKFN